MSNDNTGASAGTAANTALDDILGKAPEITEAQDDDGAQPEHKEDVKPSKEEAEGDKEPEKKVLVPHGAFHEERERRKELQKQIAIEKERNDRLEERTAKILEAMNRKPAEEEQFIDPLAKIETKVNEVVEKINKKAEQETADSKAIREENELISRYSASAQAYSKDAPDFMEARNYLIADKVKELQALEYNDAEISQEIRRIERQIVERAYSKEKNPAEVIHALAKEKGYKGADRSSKKTVEDIDKGLKASKSLGSGGSKAGDKDDLESLSASDLSDMSNEEFDSLFNKIEKQANRKH